MPNRTIINVSACSLAAILLVVILYFTTSGSANNKNNFTRLYPSHFITSFQKIDLKYNSFYIAGLTAHNIYLGNYTAPATVLVSNHELTDTQYIHLKIANDTAKAVWKSMQLTVDSPNIYLREGISPSFWHGNSPDSNLQLATNIKSFTKSTIISPSSMIVRNYDPTLRNTFLEKTSIDGPGNNEIRYPLEKQVDGDFCVDGMLHYNKEASQLIYIYYYRNQITCLDTNLQVLYKSNTIDTIHWANVKLATTKGNQFETTRMASPPPIVNRHSCIDKNRIYVHSSLKADNEDKEMFEKAHSIDVYSLKTGQYQFSFYLPRYKNNKISDFKIKDDILVVVYDHYLAVYRLDFSQIRINDQHSQQPKNATKYM